MGLSPWSIKIIISLCLYSNMYIDTYNESYVAISIGCTLTMPYRLGLILLMLNN